MVIACTLTILSKEKRLLSAAGSLKSSKKPVMIPNIGAVKKNLSGAEIGGA